MMHLPHRLKKLLKNLVWITIASQGYYDVVYYVSGPNHEGCPPMTTSGPGSLLDCDGSSNATGNTPYIHQHSPEWLPRCKDRLPLRNLTQFTSWEFHWG